MVGFAFVEYIGSGTPSGGINMNLTVRFLEIQAESDSHEEDKGVLECIDHDKREYPYLNKHSETCTGACYR